MHIGAFRDVGNVRRQAGVNRQIPGGDIERAFRDGIVIDVERTCSLFEEFGGTGYLGDIHGLAIGDADSSDFLRINIRKRIAVSGIKVDFVVEPLFHQITGNRQPFRFRHFIGEDETLADAVIAAAASGTGVKSKRVSLGIRDWMRREDCGSGPFCGVSIFKVASGAAAGIRIAVVGVVKPAVGVKRPGSDFIAPGVLAVEYRG